MYITQEPVSLVEFLGKGTDTACGAGSLFVGRVRDHHEGRVVKGICYECYPSMAERAITDLVERIRLKYGVLGLRVRHRIGWLEVGEIALVVAVESVHRSEAFEALRETVEAIKAQVPIWKREIFADGGVEWVGGQKSREGVSCA